MNTYNLTELAHSPHKMDRVMAAGHIDTPIEVVKKLLKDSTWEVRETAQRNLIRDKAIPISDESIEWLLKTDIPEEISNWLCLHGDDMVKNCIELHKFRVADCEIVILE